MTPRDEADRIIKLYECREVVTPQAMSQLRDDIEKALTARDDALRVMAAERDQAKAEYDAAFQTCCKDAETLNKYALHIDELIKERDSALTHARALLAAADRFVAAIMPVSSTDAPHKTTTFNVGEARDAKAALLEAAAAARAAIGGTP